MAATSGQFGKVLVGASSLVECTSWEFERSAAIHEYASCATSGKKKRVAGTEDATVNIEGVLDPDDRIESYIDVGDSVTLLLYFTATKYHSVPVVIESISESVDIEEGDLIRWQGPQASLNGTWLLNQS